MLEAFRRGAVRLHILHHACDGEIHGAWMRDELAEHGHRISPGTLYPVLHQMEADGLLASREEVVGGRIRRTYFATDAGHDERERCRDALRELAREVLPPDDQGGPAAKRTAAKGRRAPAAGTPGVASEI